MFFCCWHDESAKFRDIWRICFDMIDVCKWRCFFKQLFCPLGNIDIYIYSLQSASFPTTLQPTGQTHIQDLALSSRCLLNFMMVSGFCFFFMEIALVIIALGCCHDFSFN